MSRILAGLVLLALLLPSSGATAARQGEAVSLASLEGLQQVASRSWMAPFAAPGAAAPENVEQATLLLTVVVHQFDADDSAAEGWTSLTSSPRLPMPLDIGLHDLGEQTEGAVGGIRVGGQTVTYGTATVQDGPYIYSVTGQFTGLDGEQELRAIVGALVDADPGAGEGTYIPDGTSSGGIWDLLNAVQPRLAGGSSMADAVLFPVSEDPTPVSNEVMADGEAISHEDVHGFAELDGIRSMTGVDYRPEESDETADGPFQIEAWILPFGTSGQASVAVDPIAGTLAESINVQSSSNQAVSANNVLLTSTLRWGPIQDPSLPTGSGAISVQQIGSVVYVVRVYAAGNNVPNLATEIAQQVIDTPAGNSPVAVQPDGSVTGGVWDRFPQAGDPLLGGLLPATFTDVQVPGVTGRTQPSSADRQDG